MTSLLVGALAFQIGTPGQYPGQYPPGQYPPGQYPPGRDPSSQGPGIPMPRRGKKTTANDKKAAEEPTLHYTGRLRTIDEKTLEINAPDTRTMVFQINDKTSKPVGLVPGDYLAVEAREDSNGYYIALRVTKTEPPASTEIKAESGATSEVRGDAAPKTESAVDVMKGPKYEPGDEGAPKLTRGKPATRPKAKQAEDTVTTSVATAELSGDAPGKPSDGSHLALIEEAKKTATSFLGTLPNFLCQQQTTRFVSEGKGTNWRAVDVLAVDVVYEGGREKYEHLTINGKSSKKAADESGAWSTGEFGTVLADLFSPATAAKLHYSRTETIAGFEASVYKFEVERSHSHWKVYFRSQWILPAYRGTLWLDKKTGRTLRIEMQAVDIPKEFLADTTESAVDYELVNLGAQKFLLPVHAEVLSCMRGSSVCDKNVIEFRNYHKFSGDSKIVFSQ